MIVDMFILYWKPVVEIAILWLVIYHIMLFFEGTRAVQVLRGIIVLLLAFFIFEKFGLQTLDWLLTKLFGISVIAILIIFHPEIRHGLARLGQRHFFGASIRGEELDVVLKEIASCVIRLADNKFGALIAIEKKDPLSIYVESGAVIDGHVSAELIEAIFTPNNPLHDGGLIIQHGRIAAAGCLFPLTQNQDLSRIYGTRHRAALGLSEETDALIIVVSEERQDFSFVYKGRLYKDLGREELLTKIKETMKLVDKDA
ncbi:MAG: diadenylate cyclase CdaA [Candidatus Omnitrophica bacterium]|nr:diadenylate cyclase CdaA [Candidatus Omnitrophota bacterium]